MTDWFIKHPGNDFMPSQDDETMLLINGSPPDWIRVPDVVGEGAGVVRCLGQYVDLCPLHKDHQVVHYELEGQVQVAECEISGFQWYRRQE